MNFMNKELKENTENIKTTNYPTDENNVIVSNSAAKIVNNNIFYFLNKLPIIPEFRDVCIKPTSISQIKIDLSKNKPNVNDESFSMSDYLSSLPTRYCFTFTTCVAPYTKASMKYQHQFIIMFDKESTCLKYKTWFENCFKTIQEQEAEKEEEDKRTIRLKKIKELQEQLKKLED